MGRECRWCTWLAQNQIACFMLAVKELLTKTLLLPVYCKPGPPWLCTRQARPCVKCRSAMQLAHRPSAYVVQQGKSSDSPTVLSELPVLPDFHQSSPSSATSYAPVSQVTATSSLVNSPQHSLFAKLAATMMSTPLGLCTYAPHAFMGPRPFSRIAGISLNSALSVLQSSRGASGSEGSEWLNVMSVAIQCTSTADLHLPPVQAYEGS